MTSVYRDRTNLYLLYRRTIPRREPATSRFDTIVEEEEGLIGHRKQSARKNPDFGPEAIELKPLAPSIFDISHDLDENLLVIKGKIEEIGALYKKLLITTYNEKSKLETRIEDLNYDITKKFEACYVLIKKFEFLQKNHRRLNLKYTDSDLSIIENYKKNYALKIQEKSMIFRNLQNNYIKFLRDEEDEHDQLIPSSRSSPPAYDESKDIEDYSKHVLQQTQQQLQNPNDQMLASREREISKIAMGILEILTIFKEMESLVVEQGSVLDRIDYNISNTVQDLKESDRELVKALGYQKRTTRCKIIMFLSLAVFALFVILLTKSGGNTYVKAPSQDPQPADPAPDDSAGTSPERPTIDGN